MGRRPRRRDTDPRRLRPRDDDAGRMGEGIGDGLAGVPADVDADVGGSCAARSVRAGQFRRRGEDHAPHHHAGVASWVAEGAPIRVSQMPTGAGPSLEPYKLATIVLLTREMIDGSNAEAIVRQALLDSTAPALDASLFSNNAGTPGLQPPGLLNGVTPITASTSTNKTEAMDDDLAALVQAIAARAGNGSVAFVAAPAQATRILTRANATPGPVLMSASIAPKTVIGVATDALVAAVEPTAIDASRSATIHRDDSPLPIDGATPVASIFQTDEVALRLRLPVSWTVRAGGAVAVVSATAW
jgi:hypothetical protein